MAMGFGTISSLPLDALPTSFVFFEQDVYLLAPIADPVSFLTANPLKRLVFAVEITVQPLTGATTPALGSET